MKNRIAAVALLVGIAGAASAADPVVGDAGAGAAKAAVCGACHGATGNSINPIWPSLAGQHQGYITEQLALLKSGTRVAPVMQPMALSLSAQDMADLGAYFEKQALAGLEADPSLWQAGEKLYRGGDAKRSIPACIGCHGPNGRGNGPARWPQIRAQQSVYVATQLNNYAAHTRYATVAGQAAAPASAEIMSDVASRLSEADINALAAYVQGLR
ncbi:MAG TPA: c-type cytochrome [Candidatus Dormibacteraeota bacterium]|nr:c-type cytochrome [Candidatus Dormibacteraeota bacterium]